MVLSMKRKAEVAPPLKKKINKKGKFTDGKMGIKQRAEAVGSQIAPHGRRRLGKAKGKHDLRDRLSKNILRHT